MYSILMVEDDASIFELMNMTLRDIAKITWAVNVTDAKKIAESEVFDIVLLDVCLPDGNGYDLCKHILSDERYANVPVLFISGNTSVEDRLRGFDAGGDDFIAKPFSPLEVRARIQTRLEKAARLSGKNTSLRAGAVEINFQAGAAYLSTAGRKVEIEIGQTEFKLLKLLAARQDQVISREAILEAIWKGSTTDQRAVDTHVSKLRKKLSDSGVKIQSVWGQGYKLTVVVQPLSVLLAA